MRIRQQLVAVVAAAALVATALACSLAYITQRDAEARLAQVESQRIAGQVVELLTATISFTSDRSASAGSQWQVRHQQLAQTVDAALARNTGAQPAVLALQRHVVAIGLMFEQLAPAISEGPSEAAQARKEVILDRLMAEMPKLVEARYRWSVWLTEQQARDHRVTLAVMLLGPGLLLLITLLLAWLVWRRVLRPLNLLETTAAAIRAGQLDMRADTGARDELGDAARAIDAMAQSLLAANTTLSQAERQMRQVMDASPLGMFTSDSRGRLLTANRALQAICGLSEERLLGYGWRALVHPEDIRAMDAQAKLAIDEGRPLVSEHRHWHADGRVSWVRRHLSPLLGQSYDEGAVGMLEDVTARRAMDLALAAKTGELERSNVELAQFAYVAAHDLQEPLRMVASYTELLAKRYKGQLDEKADKYIFYAVDGAKRMQQLISGLLAFSRVGSQGQALVPVSAEEALQRALKSLRPALQAADATTSLMHLPTVMGDAAQLQTLFSNLLDNAVKFRAGAPLHIEVTVARQPDHWLFKVQDNGQGVEPRYGERIFQMFQRLHERGQYEGSGIGLTIARRIVERHGGRIWLDSAPGAGACFCFTLQSDAGLMDAALYI